MDFLYVFLYNDFHLMAKPLGTTNREEKGSHEAQFIEAFDAHSDALFRHAFYRLSDRERAVELVHDAFVRVWTYVRNGASVESYKALLYKTLSRLIIDEYRKRKHVSLDEILEDATGEYQPPSLHTGSLEEYEHALDSKQVLTILPRIHPLYHEAVSMRYIDEMGPKEIANILQVTENVVSLRIYRGLKAIREIIEKEELQVEDNRNTNKS